MSAEKVNILQNQNNVSKKAAELSTPLLRESSEEADIPVFVKSFKKENDKDEENSFRKRFPNPNRTGTIRHGDSLENTKFIPTHLLSYEEEDDLLKKFSKPITKVISPDEFSVDSKPHPDISAMSVISLYQSAENLDSDMDTDKDILEYSDKKPPKIVIPTELSFESQQTYSPIDKKEIIGDVNQSSQRCDHQGLDPVKCPRISNFFKDGVTSVDFVIVWEPSLEEANAPEAFGKRKMFESNLIVEGLSLEYESYGTDLLHFVKVHVPKEVLRRYAEILKLRMPMKEIPGLSLIHARSNFIVEGLTNQWDKLKASVFVDKDKFPEKGHRFTAIYRRDREYLFDVDSPCFFTPAIRSRIVQFILDRKRFSDNPKDDFAFGIERLLNDKVYSAAYPLHDGDVRQKGCTRNLLYEEWAAVGKWYRYQPLDYVKEYFGVKIALYFAWLGFYTHMLIPAAVVGLACFVLSWVNVHRHEPTNDICNGVIETKMCPLCDHWCSYWDLKESCVQAKITYLCDNPTTVFFAVFMSFWATIFLEMWKRYSAEITHRWDLTGFDIQEEHPRPQYLARLAHVKRKRMNVVTNTMEPHVPFWRIKLPATIFSFSVVILLVVLALATVLAVVLYRMSVMVALTVYADRMDNSSAMLITTSTAACINLCCILIFNWVYSFIAEYLTELELQRTQSEFDDSLTLKIYLLQFINYYASIFYIAFFKGRFIGTPDKYTTIFGYRQEECGPGGCLLELCIQLAIIMVGKQAMNTILEMLFPLFFKWINTWKIKTGIDREPSSKSLRPQWVKDFKLVEWGPRSLFPEYLEMVLQYGFVTIFVAAFPLAPLFALLNNVLEMRLDARKLLTYYRRPVSQRVRNIGVWYRILDSVSKLSVITNGFILAFTSDFIPRAVYRISVSTDLSLHNYVNFSLSYFNTSQFQVRSAPVNHTSQQFCRYPGYREPPGSKNEYEPTSMYWHILAARVIFVLVFENVVALAMIAVRWCIPDIPQDLKDRIRRETYITNEIILQQDTLRSQSGQLLMFGDGENAMNISVQHTVEIKCQRSRHRMRCVSVEV